LLSDLKAMGERQLSATIRSWLAAKRGTTRSLQLKHIDAIRRLVLSEKSGRAAELPGGGRVVKTGGKLMFDQNKVEN
jgi:hypothetical protein